MSLPNLFDTMPDETKLYLSIYIDDSQIQSALWQVEQGQVVVLRYSAAFTYQGETEALKQTDESLQELGKESEGVEEVVFGFDPDWVQDGDIAAGKKPFIKKLTQELSLKPVGFVVSTEAVAQYLSVGEPLISIIVVQLTDQFLTMNLVQRGQTLSYQKVGRSGDSVADLREAFARTEQVLGQDYLPPKIILTGSEFDKEYLQEQKSNLLDFDWKSEHPFLQPPIIEIGASDLLINAITTQGGKAVAQAAGVELSAVAPSEPGLGSPPLVNQDVSQSKIMADELGFATLDETAPPSEETLPLTHDLAVDLENGTAHSDNLGQVPSTATSFGIPMKSTAPAMNSPEANSQPFEQSKKINFTQKVKSWWTKLNQEDKQRNHKPFIIAGFLGGLLFLGGIFFLFSNSLAQAQVTVKLNTKTISQNAVITLDPTASSPDAENLVLPAQIEHKDVSGNKTIDSTGVKLIGDKAQGKVEIMNKTDSDKNFPQGTVLKSGNFVFLTADEITVPAATSQENSDGETRKYGKTEVNVTADQIGAESNLPKDEKLQVESFASNTYEAVILEEFSGGSSREVRVVSAEDLVSLKSDLKDELQQLAAQEYTDESKNGMYFVPTGNSTIAETSYSAEEGEEVNTVQLDMTLSVEAVSYSVSDLKPLARELLASQVPENYSLADEDPQILSSAEESASSSATVKLEADVSALTTPNIDLDQLKSQLLGKSIDDAEKVLRENSQLKAFTIQIQPPLLSKIVHRIPKNSAKVTLTVQDE